MDKQRIIEAVLAELEVDLRRQLAANERASAGATNSETRAETKWDTCGLEASYLARGHAEQFKTLAVQVHNLRSFVPLDFTDRPIDAGALVEVEMNGGVLLFFLLNCGGGIELDMDGREVNIITPESPVGAALLEKQAGADFSFRAGSSGKILRVE